MKRIILTMAAFATAGALLTSCNKGVINAKKLDGDWTLAEADMESNYTDTYTGGTDTEKEVSTYDGTQWTHSNTDDDGVTTTSIETGTMAVSFDRKEGTFTMTEEGMRENAYSNWISLVKFDIDGNQVDWISIYQVVGMSYNSSMSGFYTLAGGAGEEIEENSQIIFRVDNYTNEYTENYTYEDEDGVTFNTSGWKYWSWETGDYESVPSSKTGTSETDGTNVTNMVWTVAEMEKGSMTVETNTDYTSTSTPGNSSSSVTETGSMTLEQ